MSHTTAFVRIIIVIDDSSSSSKFLIIFLNAFLLNMYQVKYKSTFQVHLIMIKKVPFGMPSNSDL